MNYEKKFGEIKLLIQRMKLGMQKLIEENEFLRVKLQEKDNLLKQKEFQIMEHTKKIEDIAELERENKKFRINSQILQKSINKMIEELQDL